MGPPRIAKKPPPKVRDNPSPPKPIPTPNVATPGIQPIKKKDS